VEHPGVDHLPFVGDQDVILDDIEQFLAELRHDRDLDRVLATVLCLRRPEKNPTSASTQFDSYMRREIDWYGGRFFVAGSGCPAAAFDGPARAIRCARSLVGHAGRLHLEIGVGLHTGECTRSGAKNVSGFAVDVTSEIAATAADREILVSSTVRDLIAGSPYRFDYAATLPLPAQGTGYRVYRVSE
jgi:class 3 adenylate cyclase